MLKVLKGHNDAVSRVVRNGKHLISTSWDGSIKIWGLKDDKLINSLEEHLGKVKYVISDKRVLITGGDDKFLRIWDTKVGHTICVLKNGDFITAMCRGNQGVVYAASKSGDIREW